MHFHLPRRHRRKLLFPPGLLALAGLLWLGCTLLSNHSEQIKQRYVVSLEMPPLKLKPSESIWGRLLSTKSDDSRTWQAASFSGNRYADEQEQTRVIEVLRNIATDTKHAGGLRVRIAPTVHYKTLVFLLNAVNSADVKFYWLDIRRQTTLFYALTYADNPSAKLFCEGMGPIPVIPDNRALTPFWVHFNEQMTKFWKLEWLQPLRQPEWRNSMWLLAAMAALSIWRTIRAWRTA